MYESIKIDTVSLSENIREKAVILSLDNKLKMTPMCIPILGGKNGLYLI